MEIPTPPAPKAQEIVRRLMDSGLSAQQIADGMDNRVSWRTIYRWAKGEHAPQQPADMTALLRVAEKHLSEKSETPL